MLPSAMGVTSTMICGHKDAMFVCSATSRSNEMYDARDGMKVDVISNTYY